MAVLDRLKLRIETDLPDGELQSMIDAETAEMVARFGPNGPVVFTQEGPRNHISLHRPIDEGQTVSIVDGGITLASDDYRIENGGLSIKRLADGTNPGDSWGSYVTVNYTPIDNQAQRDEATINLVKLAITYHGMEKTESIGDASISGVVAANAYQAERETLFQMVAARGRWVFA